MRLLYGPAIRHPWRVATTAAVVTLLAVPGLFRLRLETDGRSLAPEQAPAIRIEREIRERFDQRDPLVILLERSSHGGIFEPAVLRSVAELSEALQARPEIRPQDVSSLATELGFRHRQGSLRLRTLLEPLPETAPDLERLRDDLRRISLYDGVLVSRDGNAAAVLVGTPPDIDRAAWVDEIATLAEGWQSDETTISVLGAPAAEALLGRHILADLGGGLPPAARPGLAFLAAAIMALVFAAVFRRGAAVLLPMTEIGACLVIVFGVMGWAGIPVFLTLAVLPVILTAIAAADEIHIFRRYLELRSEEPASPDHEDLVRQALDDMSPPVLRTSLTTAAAFLSFALSPIEPIRAFGLLAAFGVLVCCVWSLTVIPALLVGLGPDAWVRRGGTKPGLGPFFGLVARWIPPRRRMLLAAAAVLALVAVDGVRRLEVQDSWLDGFSPEHPMAEAFRRFDQDFLGSHRLQIEVSARAPSTNGRLDAEALGDDSLAVPLDTLANFTPDEIQGSWLRLAKNGGVAATRPAREWTTWVEEARRENGSWTLVMPRQGGSAIFWLRPRPGDELEWSLHKEPFGDPTVLQRIAELETFLTTAPGVGGVLGPARLLETAGFMLSPQNPDSRRLPEDPRSAKALWSNFTTMRGEEKTLQLVDADRSRGLITVHLPDSNYRATRELLGALETWAAEHLAPAGLEIRLAGDVAVSQALIDAVVTTQVRSLILSLAAIFLLSAWIGRSLREGLLCALPPTFAVWMCFAAMGWLGVPLGVATSMFAGMILGLGVDHTIHLLAHYRRARDQGRNGSEAVAAALGSTGPAITIDALAVGLGFSVLLASQVPANARLGGLLVLGIVTSFTASLVLIPAWLAGTATEKAEPSRPVGPTR